MHQQLDTQPDALAEIYARSLFELAEQEGGRAKIEEIADELEGVMELTQRDEMFVEFLRSAILPVDVRAASLKRIFEGRVSPLALRFLLVLNMKGRLAHVGAIAASYDNMVQERFGRIEVDVYTASPIDSAQLQAISARLKSVLGREPVLHPYVDEAMIGGLKLQIGDQLVDGSVATRLRRMREQVSAHGAARIRSQSERFFVPGV